MSVYFISGGIVLSHFVYKYSTNITNYINKKIIDYRVNNLQTNMLNLHDIIDSLEQRLLEKQMECQALDTKNQELQSELLELNGKLSDFINTNYEFLENEEIQEIQKIQEIQLN